ncbi:MAG TPA: methylated-DNA--[protein]-cysteine S-methyltransferase [Ktedonobacteraceae bacterium]|nr:methylated-DNA--[protein]-cysteine S-methyltransferase [Ktedonobacteraceae bacterium]
MAATAQKIDTLYWSSVPGPRGTCVIMATEAGVCWTGTPGITADSGFAWLERRGKLAYERAVEREAIAPLRQAVDEMRRYFAGERVQFACPLDLRGTPFQVAVWQEMYRIPYGETRTYGELARILGRPQAPRAVGAASAANPVAVIVPCHRVVGSDGSLTGYGGGLPTKAWLLALEQGKFSL